MVITRQRRMQHRGAISGWVGWDGLYPGGMEYRTPYSANKTREKSYVFRALTSKDENTVAAQNIPDSFFHLLG